MSDDIASGVPGPSPIPPPRSRRRWQVAALVGAAALLAALGAWAIIDDDGGGGPDPVGDRARTDLEWPVDSFDSPTFRGLLEGLVGDGGVTSCVVQGLLDDPSLDPGEPSEEMLERIDTTMRDLFDECGVPESIQGGLSG